MAGAGRDGPRRDLADAVVERDRDRAAARLGLLLDECVALSTHRGADGVQDLQALVGDRRADAATRLAENDAGLPLT